MISRMVALVLLLLMGAAWGLQFAMLKLASTSGYSDIQVLVLALASISVIYGVWVIGRGNGFRFSRDNIGFFVITAILGYILPISGTLMVAPYLSAGVIVILASLSPVVTFATAALFRTERLTGCRIVALLVGVGAVLVILLPGADTRNLSLWALLALIVPICYGVESVYVDLRWPRNMDVVQVGFGEALVALILVLPLFVFDEAATWRIDSFGSGSLAVLVFVLCGVFEIVAYFHLIRTTGGVLVSFGTFVSLFAGIGWGILLFDERHGWVTWFAGALMTISLFLVVLDTIADQLKTKSDVG